MNLPVRPPILPRALATPLAAPAIAGPAVAWALERPSEALDLKLAAASPVFSVAFDAACWAFAWVDSPRRATRDVNLADCLKTAREAIMTIVKSSDGGNGYKASKVVTDVVERQWVDERVAGAVFAMARSSTASKNSWLSHPCREHGVSRS